MNPCRTSCDSIRHIAGKLQRNHPCHLIARSCVRIPRICQHSTQKSAGRILNRSVESSPLSGTVQRNSTSSENVREKDACRLMANNIASLYAEAFDDIGCKFPYKTACCSGYINAPWSLGEKAAIYSSKSLMQIGG